MISPVIGAARFLFPQSGSVSHRIRKNSFLKLTILFLAIALMSTRPSQAADAIILRAASPPSTKLTTTFYGATWTGNQFVVVGESGAIVTSADGENWIDHSVPIVFPLFAVAGNTTMIVAVGYGGEIWSSPDGSAWTQRFPGVTSNLYGVAVGTGPDLVSEFVVAGSEGTLLTTTSPLNVTSADANIWYTQSSPTASDLNAISYGSGRFKVVGNHFTDLSGDHATILDGGSYGASWSTVASGASVDLFGFTAYNSFFLAVGESGTAMFTPFSSDTNVGVSASLLAASFGVLPNDIVTVGKAGAIVASFDEGASWKQQYSPTSQNLFALAMQSTKARFLIAGEAGTLLYGDIVHDDIFNSGFDF
jgi:photosystem II stability/assembly factor-like uncharacterized protein